VGLDACLWRAPDKALRDSDQAIRRFLCPHDPEVAIVPRDLDDLRLRNDDSSHGALRIVLAPK
jgi:hypothetical protein